MKYYVVYDSHILARARPGGTQGAYFMPNGTTVLGLEEIRKRRGVSLEQISTATKISTSFLRAIETEEFEKLPGGVFNINYIRQYAVEIGFPVERLMAQHQAFEDSKQKADAEQQAQCVARRSGSFRWLRVIANAGAEY